MTIKHTIKLMLARTRGTFTLAALAPIRHDDGAAQCISGLGMSGTMPVLSDAQIKRALRELPHVKCINGVYRVKGRATPAR